MTTIKTSVLATAAALTAFASGAFAMDVDVYGVVDLGMHWTNSNPSKHAFVMDSGITKGSRVGMRGKENLGGAHFTDIVNWLSKFKKKPLAVKPYGSNQCASDCSSVVGVQVSPRSMRC